MLELLALSAAGIVALMLATWLISLILRDASIVDIVWGLGFAVVALIGLLFGDGYGPRKILITGMTAAWGLRLAIYLFIRNAGKGEDFRYQRMRAHYGSRFGLISLFTVFGLQGLLMFVVSLPVQAAQAAGPDHLTWLDAAGATVWLTGLLFESVGDWQLARFKADPRERGQGDGPRTLGLDPPPQLLRRQPRVVGHLPGRGEPAGPTLWVIVGPIVMTFLLVRVSGVALLERSLVKRRPGYDEYIARTSAFIPRPPRKAAGQSTAARQH
jgi:steroid 5-alpha reductase family enzyme